MELVHVVSGALDENDSRPLHVEWVRTRLKKLYYQLVIPQGVTVTSEVLFGEPASVLLAYATRVGASLVTTGTHGRGFVARAMLGSVTTKLLRGSTCALLTVPRNPLPALAPSSQDATVGQSQDTALNWAALLKEFTKRNAGRRTILEVDDLEIGAQSQEYNYPLLASRTAIETGAWISCSVTLPQTAGTLLGPCAGSSQWMCSRMATATMSRSGSSPVRARRC